MDREESVEVHIPGPLRQYSSGAAKVDLPPGPVLPLISELDRRFPGIATRILDDQGRVRQHVNLFLNEESIKSKDLSGVVAKAGDRLQILPSVSGG
jgi:molybdopterin synthase sulfur carrier subunit